MREGVQCKKIRWVGLLVNLPLDSGRWQASCETFDLPTANGDAPASFIVSICGEILFPESSGVYDYRDERLFHITIANEGRFQRNRALLGTSMSQPFRAIAARRAIARSAIAGISGFVSPTGRLYGQVTNAGGKHWTGLGFAEQATIEDFQQRKNPGCRAAECSPSLGFRSPRHSTGAPRPLSGFGANHRHRREHSRMPTDRSAGQTRTVHRKRWGEEWFRT